MENKNERQNQGCVESDSYTEFDGYKDQCNHHHKKRSWGSLRNSYFMNGPRQGFTCGTVLLTYST